MSGTVHDTDPRAQRLLRAAHDRIYRWPDGFAGFLAAVEITVDGVDRIEGALDVHAMHGAAFTPYGAEPVAPLVAAEAVSLAVWLAPQTFAARDGRFGARFRPDLDRAAGRAIEVIGCPRSTVRWIDGADLTLTAFEQRDGRHELAVLATQPTHDGRRVALRTSEQIDDGATTASRDVTQGWVTVDDVVLPAARTVQAVTGSFERVDIVLRDHRVASSVG